MDPALSAAIREAYASCPTNTHIIETVELFHPVIADRLYLVKASDNMELGLETGETVVFKACGFEVTLPGTEAEMTISICNVDRQVAEFMELAASMPYPLEVTFRPYLPTDLTYPQMDPPLTLFMNDARVTTMTASGRASFANILNKKFPSPAEYYTLERFPGL